MLFLFIFYCTGILYMLLYSLSAKKFLTIRGSTQVWLKGAVLKTARGFIARGGSNPSSSAIISNDKAVLLKGSFFCFLLDDARKTQIGYDRSKGEIKGTEMAHTDAYWMKEALKLAEKARVMGEVPIGAVIIKEESIVGYGYNQRETKQQAGSHAEMTAIEQACRTLGNWRLENCTLYVTLEPCPMCAGAIVQSRIVRVVYGAADEKAGCAGTLMNLLNEPRFNHQAVVESGVMEKECGAALSSFFLELRQKKKAERLKRREQQKLDSTIHHDIVNEHDE